MRPRATLLAFFSAAAAFAGCNAIFGVEGGQLSASSTSGTGGGTSTATTTASATSSATTGTGGTGTGGTSTGGTSTGGTGGGTACPAEKIPPCHQGDAGGAICDPIALTALPPSGYVIGLVALGDAVYWASGNGMVTAAKYDGTPLGSWGAGSDSGWLATDGASIFYTDWYDGKVRGVKLDAAHTLFDVAAPVGTDAGMSPASSAGRMVAHGGMVYWMTNTPEAVLASKTDGSQVYGTKVADKQDTSDNLGASLGVAADDAHVYWTDAGKVRRIPVGKLGDPTAVVDFAVDPGANDVIVDADRVYWTSDAGVSSKKLDGSGLTVFPVTGDQARALMFDDAWVYWTQSGGRVVRAKRGGSVATAEVVVNGPPDAYGLAADCGAIYWSTFNYSHGSLYKVRKP
jgi:hypothetical protein